MKPPPTDHHDARLQPQNEYMERHTKLHGRRLDHEERARKRAAREGHEASDKAQNLRGLRAKLHAQKRHKEKIQMRKQIKAHEERNVKSAAPDKEPANPVPAYLLDRNNPTSAKALSSSIKNKRSEKAARFAVPLPKVRGISEEEMFKVINTGKKTQKKGWKRMVTKPTFVGPDFTRRPVKYERFIRPMGLRYKKANVTHPELGVTVQLPIISVKKNPQNPLYTQLGVLSKGTVLEVNVSELGLTVRWWSKPVRPQGENDADESYRPHLARSFGDDTLKSPTTLRTTAASMLSSLFDTLLSFFFFCFFAGFWRPMVIRNQTVSASRALGVKRSQIKLVFKREGTENRRRSQSDLTLLQHRR